MGVHQVSVNEQAFEDWFEGMSYKDLAAKYDTTINTVKSWYRRYEWKVKKEERKQKSVHTDEPVCTPIIEVIPPENRLRILIERDLREQLAEKGIAQSHYLNLIDDYMSMWDIKNLLIADIKDRGVTVMGMHSEKKNDSIGELNKTNAQMLRILSDLGLKATDIEIIPEDEDDEL